MLEQAGEPLRVTLGLEPGEPGLLLARAALALPQRQRGAHGHQKALRPVRQHGQRRAVRVGLDRAVGHGDAGVPTSRGARIPLLDGVCGLVCHQHVTGHGALPVAAGVHRDLVTDGVRDRADPGGRRTVPTHADPAEVGAEPPLEPGPQRGLQRLGSIRRATRGFDETCRSSVARRSLNLQEELRLRVRDRWSRV